MPTQLERLDALIADQESSVQDAFLEFVRTVNSEQVYAEIADRLEQHDVEGALQIVDSYTVRMANVIPEIVSTVGTATASELASLAGTFAMAISFDPTHSRAAELTRANRMLFIRQFTTEQRAATRQAIARAFEEGLGTQATARAFRDSIGLTTWQEGYVSGFENKLRTLDSRALTMALRDRRFDRTVQRAINLGRALTENQIQTMVERYRAAALISRSETISRTEAIRATSIARNEALQQMLEQTNIDPGRVTQIWNATLDNRTRDWHASMEGQRRSIDDPFVDGNGEELQYPGDPAASAQTTINCRCTLTFDIAPPA